MDKCAAQAVSQFEQENITGMGDMAVKKWYAKTKKYGKRKKHFRMAANGGVDNQWAIKHKAPNEKISSFDGKAVCGVRKRPRFLLEKFPYGSNMGQKANWTGFGFNFG